MLSSHRLLQDLVRIPSVNPMGRAVTGDMLFEFRVTDYLERFFRDLGVACERRPVAPLRDNLVARFESPANPTTILLEVHQDTVPVDGMTIDPFGGEILGGKLYGRGSCDVKGGMAAMLTAFARLVKEKPARAANVVVACTVDEEHTFVGVQQLMKEGLRADFAVVAEPTKLQIVDAHKGVVRWKVRTEGRACHSSRPDQGVNAVYRMGRVLPIIEEYADRMIGSTPHARLGPPTLSVGRIEGGVSVNTVPDGCVIEVDRRLLPGEDPQLAWRDFHDHLCKNSPVPVVVDPIWLACPALDNDRADEVRRRLGSAINAVEGRHEVLAVPFGTDASSIALAGIPAIVFGPGDIAQAHTKDEWIELDQVDRAAEILYRFFVA
ncbi:MAG TPA: M20 family metallopeptidase [Gemmataceae bacterium]|nr:M20 family metallopeptidase [Gemmataceae bacterium]